MAASRVSAFTWHGRLARAFCRVSGSATFVKAAGRRERMGEAREAPMPRNHRDRLRGGGEMTLPTSW